MRFVPGTSSTLIDRALGGAHGVRQLSTNSRSPVRATSQSRAFLREVRARGPSSTARARQSEVKSTVGGHSPVVLYRVSLITSSSFPYTPVRNGERRRNRHESSEHSDPFQKKRLTNIARGPSPFRSCIQAFSSPFSLHRSHSSPTASRTFCSFSSTAGRSEPLASR